MICLYKVKHIMKKLLFVVVLFLLCPLIIFGENFEIKEFGITMFLIKTGMFLLEKVIEIITF